MAKKSETLAQREKAQRDLIELKKMQAGEIAPGPKPSEEAVAPKTFKEKVANFFYHYKLALIAGVFGAVVLGILIGNLITRTDYDAKVVVFSYDSGYSLFSNQIAEYFEEIYEDINQNGAVDIAVIDCSVDPTGAPDLRSAKLTKLNTMLTVDADTLLYVMDEASVKHFSDNLEVELFKEENIVYLGEDFYKAIEIEGTNLPQTKLFVAMREIDGTTIDGKDEAAEAAAKKVLDALRAKAGEAK